MKPSSCTYSSSWFRSLVVSATGTVGGAASCPTGGGPGGNGGQGLTVSCGGPRGGGPDGRGGSWSRGGGPSGNGGDG
eukprot:CAMPEP_0197938030 /NCGR_PEP_ID=MMETSP1439-20131203/117472_1 /TAXON_ID=66791 /ORGANISM="Gonyaulax spinifera, Strain CCMP409" /LENGTH=76 /DNA_ID=CAMNT_0043561083 /DNA_START=238 /DNA_END=465 /DNA_ORIENTATION=-